jgi:Mrp family chromosome partitioning ATPase
MDQPRVIVTSADANEGKTITCTNLALSFARAGRRVVLVDLDLRQPNAHRLVGAHNEFGVTDVLLGIVPRRASISSAPVRR